MHWHALLPDGTTATKVPLNGKTISFQNKKIESASYAHFDLAQNGVSEITVAYR